MRTAVCLRRACFRLTWRRFPTAFTRYERHTASHQKWCCTRYPLLAVSKRPATLLSAALSPAVFVALSEEDDADGKTPEEHMLEASRAEIAKEIPEDVHGLARIWKAIILGIDVYIIEPIATALRFFHLVIIFVPILGTTPVIFFGARQKDKQNERAGTIWWYSFLVHSMERAGPAFIKVSLEQPLCTRTMKLISAPTAGSMGRLTKGYLSRRDV